MILTCPEHVFRAAYHRGAGKALHEAADHGWAAVCYFYSAYHLARAALISDPIFDDWDALRAVDPGLIPEDRYATKHQMRRGSEKDHGVNDLVALLYPPIRTPYVELHGASTAVRYKMGTSTSLDDLRSELDFIEGHLLEHERLPTLGAELQRVRA